MSDPSCVVFRQPRFIDQFHLGRHRISKDLSNERGPVGPHQRWIRVAPGRQVGRRDRGAFGERWSVERGVR